jgi:hypothetical protein
MLASAVVGESHLVCNAIPIYYISYWLGLLGFWTLSIVQHSEQHRVSEKAPVSKMCSPEYHMMDKVQKHSNDKCFTPTSEPFRVYLILNVLHQLLHWERMAHKLDCMLPDRTCVYFRVSNKIMRTILEHKNKWSSNHMQKKSISCLYKMNCRWNL